MPLLELHEEANEAEPRAVARRPALFLAAAAGLCWACALALLLSGWLDATHSVLAPIRVVFYFLVLAAGLLTFVPVQRQLGLPGLAFEGVAGSFLLLYAFAFIPAPTGWLLALPDLPVYIIFLAAVFWTSAAIVMPLTYALGRRIFRQRARQYDRRRARRQAHEVGALIALYAAMAGLRVLTPLGMTLLALIIGMAELLLLSFIETEWNR